MEDVICSWSTYKNTHCRRNINFIKNKTNRLCKEHCEHIKQFKIIDDCTEANTCSRQDTHKIVPRSYKHLKLVMDQYNIYDDIVIAHTDSNNIDEEADITNEHYINILTDDTKYFYEKIKNEKNVCELKLVLTHFCNNKAVVNYMGVDYCEECYKKILNVPKLSILKKILSIKNE
jgi:hypothetical protein